MAQKFYGSRRTAVKSSIFGLLAVSLPNVLYSREFYELPGEDQPKLFSRYPSIDDEIVSEVVGVSHFNLDRLKELVNGRPELARATWDWGFGDWETAIGAASHVGRRDIAEFLMENGARPDIFTFAMLGSYQAVRSVIEARPGVQTIYGPHGISLLRHAYTGSRNEGLSETQKTNFQKLIDYLEQLGDADPHQEQLAMGPQEKEKYLGDYKYGEGDHEGFSIRLNMRDLLSLGKIGKFGGSLLRQSNGEFEYNGITSVKISFQIEAGKVISLTVTEPDLVLKALKV